MKSRLFVFAALLLCLVQLLVVLASWILSALCPHLGLASLLSAQGLRWLLSSYVSSSLSEPMAWLFFAAFVVGAVRQSQLTTTMMHWRECDYAQRFALRVAAFEVVIALLLCLLLAVLPHSFLLGVTGQLFSGPFLRAAALLVGAALFFASLSFTLLGGRLKTFGQAEELLLYGVRAVLPLAFLLVLATETMRIIQFVIPD